MSEIKFDLLSTVEYGGCSAKLPAGKLTELLQNIPLLKDKNILVDIETHDDAGVYRLNDTTALIVTTDFFPPVCSDPYEFGEIAAANSLSDVYAMGGTPLLALNLNMFPSSAIPLEVLRDILLGGQNKINEAGAFTMGGHTIDDTPPKYGLAVVGTVHPERLVTNSGARPGDKLILTKPLGVGILISAHRIGIAQEAAYRQTLAQMKRLNKEGAELMQQYDIKGATDVTGFGLLGHLLKMAQASDVSVQVEGSALPLLPQVAELIDEGCIPGAAFRNMEFVKNHCLFATGYQVNRKIAALDAQTSGGLLISVPEEKAERLLSQLKDKTYPDAAIIGEVFSKRSKYIYFR